MTDLSVVIVNYNVKEFLRNCLQSLLDQNITYQFEVIVVDNNSIDDSISLIKANFPTIRIISNEKNLGFSKACNQGIEISKGRYILFLNPDTVLGENVLQESLECMETNSNIGALGVKMLDGNGKFLPESKRGIPSPLVAFWRFSGIYKIFPESSFFNSYYAGHINENTVSEVKALTGAFMMVRKKALRNVGLFDEDYFMYGEDLDLSYRLTKGGYKILYYPKVHIIHYKGMSTQKGGLQYIRRFYGAMLIFYRKHFDSKMQFLFSSLIYLAIILNAGIRTVFGFLKSVFKIIVDLIVFSTGFFLIKHLWAKLYFKDPDYYLNSPVDWIILSTITIFILVGIFYQNYKVYHKPGAFNKVVIWGSIVSLIFYSLLPDSFRTSRALLLLGAFWIWIAGLGIRSSYRLIHRKIYSGIEQTKSFIVGIDTEVQRINNELKNNRYKLNILKSFLVEENTSYSELQKKLQLNIRMLNPTEIIFCLKDISIEFVLRMMTLTRGNQKIRVIGDESYHIIGSKDNYLQGGIHSLELQYNISKQEHLIGKRLLDIVMASLLLLLSPILIFRKKHYTANLVKNIFAVFTGKLSVVSYFPADEKIKNLPKLKNGIFYCKHTENVQLDQISMHHYNTEYALDYSEWKDFLVVISNL